MCVTKILIIAIIVNKIDSCWFQKKIKTMAKNSSWSSLYLLL